MLKSTKPKYGNLYVLILAMLLSTISACSGESSSQSLESIDVTGQWVGTLGNNSIVTQGCGTPAVSYVMNLTQTDNNLSGDGRFDCGGFLIHDLSGTITGTQLDLAVAVSQESIILLVDSDTKMVGTMKDSLGEIIADIRLER